MEGGLTMVVMALLLGLLFFESVSSRHMAEPLKTRLKRHSLEHSHHDHHQNAVNSFLRQKQSTPVQNQLSNLSRYALEHPHFMDYLFDKYGNGTHMFFEAVEHMWGNLGFNNHVFDHSIEHHKDHTGDFVPMHQDHDHDKVLDDHDHDHDHHGEEYKELKDHVGEISAESGPGCLSAMQLYDVLKMKINQTISKTQFLNLCPFILSQLEKKSCRPVPLTARKGTPTSYASAWVGALVSVSLISLAGLIVISVVPILSRSKYFEQVVQFLISLAVGTLTSDALLHLLPHAMVPHSHEPSLEEVDITALNHKYISELSRNALWVGVVTFASIVFFFFIERLLKALATKDLHEEDEQIEIKNMSEDDGHDGHNHSHHVPSGILASAWMVAMGDGLHNFADGLAIGASFANSLPVGISTSVAVLCHELPHELGDFASLLSAGMTTKQAVFCNLVSSVMCLVGVCLGVSIGNHVQSLTTWVFAVTAGIFLYIALVDMLPLMTKTYNMKEEGLSSEKPEPAGLVDRFLKLMRGDWVKRLCLHLSGVGVGLTIMLLIGLYEDRIVIDIV